MTLFSSSTVLKTITMVTIAGITSLLAISLVTADPIGPQNDRAAEAIGTGFGFQGFLDENGTPINGTRNFKFSLYNAETGGQKVGTTVARDSVGVENGYFSVQLDFGNVIYGQSGALYLEIDVDGTVLAPRQPILPQPYAMEAGRVDWSNITNVPSDFNGPPFGETWTTSGDYLTISGSVLNEPFAPILMNVNDIGIRVENSSSASFWTDKTDFSSLWVTEAIVTGVWINDVTGGFIGEVEYLGAGVVVSKAKDFGVRVFESARGFQVDKATTYGLNVIEANEIGVRVLSADTDGDPLDMAALFDGDVMINGSLLELASTTRIDHPQKPGEKYLSHAGVHSPDMLNVYTGNVTLDEDGSAWVEMPDYLEALNINFTYQLTPIGAAAPGLFVGTPMTDNRFQISGGEQGLLVSWQVTGVRSDPYAVANPIEVEEDKAMSAKGTYLFPEAYAPESRSAGDADPHAYSDPILRPETLPAVNESESLFSQMQIQASEE